MPRRKDGYTRMETLPVADRLLEPDYCQAHWYRLLGPWVHERSVIEVGAGTGYGTDIMREAGASVVHGLDPLPLRSDIIDTPFETVNSKSYDVAVACDVIEHVENDVGFFRDLLRVARQYVFISTPNWNISHAANPFHVREYTPAELNLLLTTYSSGYKRCTFFSSNERSIVRGIDRLSDAENNFGVLIEVSR